MYDGRHPGATAELDAVLSRHALNEPSAALLIAVPLYRSPELLQPLVIAFAKMADELRELSATILFINDSPDDSVLQGALDAAVADLARHVAVEQLANEHNIGFVRTANRAMEIALATDRDVILLNSDAVPQPGAFSEMAVVAYLDPLIGVVSPRSNNATICNSPIADRLRAADAQSGFRAHKSVEHHLARYTYVPTAVGFCLLVRRAMLAEFGYFDTIYGEGYNEENDFVRRCNQRGYRAALANHAYVIHQGEVSFSQTSLSRSERQKKNHALLLARYPEYENIVERYFSSAAFRAEYVLGGLVPIDGRLAIIFDCRVLGEFYNGTFEHIRCLLRSFARLFSDRYDIRILCDLDAFRFHRLDEIEPLNHFSAVDAARDPSAIAFRLCQPDAEAAATLSDFAPITGALMLDTISMDCEQLDDRDLHDLWQGMAFNLDLIGFNSDFSRQQFGRRFDLADHALHFVSPCSMETSDYCRAGHVHVGGGGILLIGNQYPHKHMREMVLALRASRVAVPIVSFGLEIDEPEVCASYRAGHISEETVDALYCHADVALFPSHYEGFGLPIMHALARRLPVIARDLPCAREIRETSPVGHNLHLCASTEEMAELAGNPPAWRDMADSHARSRISWDTAATALADAFEEAASRFDFPTCRRHQAAAIAIRRQSEGAAAEAARARLEDGMRLGQEGIIALRQRLEEAEARAMSAEIALSTARLKGVGGGRRAIDADILSATTASSRPSMRATAFSNIARFSAIWENFRTEMSLRSKPSLPLENIVPRDADGEGVSLVSKASDMAVIRKGLIRWTANMAIGEPVRIRIRKSALGPRSSKVDCRRAIFSLFAIADCAVTHIRFSRSSLSAFGRKTAKWISPSPALDERAIIAFAYRALLLRDPDESGFEHYHNALAQGSSLDDLLFDIAASEERWSNMLSRQSN